MLVFGRGLCVYWFLMLRYRAHRDPPREGGQSHGRKPGNPSAQTKEGVKKMTEEKEENKEEAAVDAPGSGACEDPANQRVDDAFLVEVIHRLVIAAFIENKRAVDRPDMLAEHATALGFGQLVRGAVVHQHRHAQIRAAAF